MHVDPSEFRSVRGGRLNLRFALLRDVAYVLAEAPNGSGGTALEEPCDREHWAFVVEGALDIRTGRRRRSIETGTAFHIAAGTQHRLVASVPTRLAGFSPIDPKLDVSDAALQALGFEIRPPGLAPGSDPVPAVVLADQRLPERGQIVARSHRMGDLIFTTAAFGARTGYTTRWCDLAHWGLVTRGALAIEWEDDIEVLTAGDVFYCPAGPPGHRIQSAEGAGIIDYTPASALLAGGRVPVWRQDAAADLAAGDRTERTEPVAVASLG